jgi:GTP-binding protein EngB required for normal cell division
MTPTRVFLLARKLSASVFLPSLALSTLTREINFTRAVTSAITIARVFGGTQMNSSKQESRESLNPYQARRLRVTCQYIDKVLGDIEGILNSTASKAAFPRYASDITPAQRRTIEDYVARVRAQLVRVLEGQGIEREKPSIPASRAVHVMLGGIDIAAEELKPKYMRGYGTVPESVATELNGIVGELAGLIERFDRYLSEGVGEDLGARLERLEQAGNDLELLERIEQTVRDRGLVEFRSSIAAILDRAEDRSFEIAVFGRVSSGKSSLLNAVLETDVLSVGVTPITAVPTRVTHAEVSSLTVSFSEAPRKKFEISHLQEFATEQQNPGNMKHVTRLVVALPSPRLQGGISFVDTPGLGSLATSGATETLAYLPKCDLGVVLIDAGSTLTADDLQTILSLQQAAIPVNILLSKADVLGSEDRVRIVRYVKEHIASECKLELPVHPVSVLPSCKEMLNGWFENQIAPLYARSQELRTASLRRKIGTLRDSVVAALEARLRRGSQSSSETMDRARVAEALIRRTTGQIEETRSLCGQFIEEASVSAPEAINEASKRFLHSLSTGSYGVVVPGQLVRDSITQFIQLQVGRIQGDLTTLAEQLGNDLRHCAADLAVPDAPGAGEFQSVIRGTPVFESPSLRMLVSRPALSGLLGRRMVERQVARQISSQLPKPFYAALEAYWQLVRDWAESVIGQLKQKFEIYAENYRAQAEQALGGKEFAKDELDGLEEDLARLKMVVVPESESDEFDSTRRVDTTQETSKAV